MEGLFAGFNTEYLVNILESYTPYRAALCIKDIYPEMPLYSPCYVRLSFMQLNVARTVLAFCPMGKYILS